MGKHTSQFFSKRFYCRDYKSLKSIQILYFEDQHLNIWPKESRLIGHSHCFIVLGEKNVHTCKSTLCYIDTSFFESFLYLCSNVILDIIFTFYCSQLFTTGFDEVS